MDKYLKSIIVVSCHIGYLNPIEQTAWTKNWGKLKITTVTWVIERKIKNAKKNKWKDFHSETMHDS